MRAIVTLTLLPLALAACGGGQEHSALPDESGDLEVSSQEQRTSHMPEGLDGTRWRWVEAFCTEGPLDLTARGYAATVHVHEQDGGLTLVRDEQFATEQCKHTVITRAVPPEHGADWHMEEVARVAVPSTRECVGHPEEPRPGEVRIRDDRLEVLVQRSQWCNGLEVRMVYERAPEAPLTDDEIVRRYVAYFDRGDAPAEARLFAETGSLLEPFTRTETGDPYRHDGRQAVEHWFAEAFGASPWRAMRITDVQEPEGASAGTTQRVLTWEYMDPRLTQPMTGRTRFTIAGGEIFEAQIELTSTPDSSHPEAGGAETESSNG